MDGIKYNNIESEKKQTRQQKQQKTKTSITIKYYNKDASDHDSNQRSHSFFQKKTTTTF